jgi:uncharacterized membrane protein YfcA
MHVTTLFRVLCAAGWAASAEGAEIFFFQYPNPFVWWQIALFAFAAFIGSAAIGAVGVGGAMIVPFMLMLPGMEGPVAIGTLFVAFIPAVVVRLVWWARAKNIKWSDAAPLGAGAIPGSIGGAILVQYSPRPLLALFVGAVCLFSGIHTAYKMYVAYREAATAKKLSAAHNAVPEPTTASPDETGSESGQSSPHRSEQGSVDSASSAISSEAFEYVFRGSEPTKAADADVVSLDDISMHSVVAATEDSVGSTIPVPALGPRTLDSPAIINILIACNEQLQQERVADACDPCSASTDISADILRAAAQRLQQGAGAADTPHEASDSAAEEMQLKVAEVGRATLTTSEAAAPRLCETSHQHNTDGPKCTENDIAAATSEAASSEKAHPKIGAQERILRFFLLGFFTSCGSVLSGTGGPLLLFPFLMIVMPNVPVHALLGLAAPFTTAVCVGATIGSISHGKMDGGLALILAVVSTFGMLGGAHFAMKVPAFQLRLLVAALLVITAVVTIRDSVVKLRESGLTLK